MRGVWFLGFCYVTLALASGRPQRYTDDEPICLVYSYDTLTNAMRNVHAHYAGKHAGYPDRNYKEGVIRHSASDYEKKNSAGSGIYALQRALKNEQRRTKCSVDKQQEHPIDLHFGDMLRPYEKEDGSVTNLFTTQYRPIDLHFSDMLDIR